MDQQATEPVQQPNVLVSPLAQRPQTVVIDLTPDQIFVAKERRRSLKLADEQTQHFINNIRQVGFIHPVEVRKVEGGPAPYELVCGRLRLAVAKHIGMASIPAKVIEATDNQMEFIAISENTMRKQMPYPEFVKMFKAFMRRMHELYGPDPGNALGGKARAKGAKRDAQNGQVTAEHRTEPPENGHVEVDSPALPETGNAGDERPKTHRQRAEEITGKSHQRISETFTAAEAFSEDDLMVLAEREITQTDMIRLARLEPEAVRIDALAWIAGGETAEDAIRLALEKVKRDSEEAKKPKQPSENELSDADWLVAYCSKVRQQLQDPSTFDRDALCYRHTRKDRQVQKTTAKADLEKALGPGYAPFAQAAWKHLFAEHPKDWYICHECNGRNKDQPECDHCYGTGYRPAFVDRKRKK